MDKDKSKQQSPKEIESLSRATDNKVISIAKSDEPVFFEARGSGFTTKSLEFFNKASISPFPAFALSAAHLVSIPFLLKNRVGYFSLLPTLGFATIFGVSGMALKEEDKINGVGAATAWCLTWLFFNTRKAFKAKRPGPIMLAAAVAAVGSTYSYKYYQLNFPKMNST